MRRSIIISLFFGGVGLFFAFDVFCFYVQWPSVFQFFHIPIAYKIFLTFSCILASLVFAGRCKKIIFIFWCLFFLSGGFLLDFKISSSIQKLEVEIIGYINKGEGRLGVVDNESNFIFPGNCHVEKKIALEIWRRVDFYVKCADGSSATISSYLDGGLPVRTLVRKNQ